MNKKITILDSISFIEMESFNKPWNKNIIKSMFESKEYLILVEYVKKEIVGYIILYNTSDVVEVLRVAVMKKFRNQGIGKTLLEKAIDETKKIGYNEIFLEVRVTNYSAIYLYKKVGFEKINIRKNYYKDSNEDALIMKKKL
ncbi:ribosomal protein S18-alanine N-acetyltransferase [Haliovirga abyssi]|uniref:[Ribosomal protein bS18]-alanine N-acetyltransferase n=1 Tax=Haliovirga abyssi TaxID=2996794 RepID=A0AAU9DEI5_9FUSO|nr:ribosomal protein S18-alanine N-acetyltransferase [Haliovirga abyssi]BDU49747.1 ribosomal-protein-alanine acetyltransferase [Haliovirga abyssi]